MKRRDFLAAIAASAVFVRSWSFAQSTTKRPRLLLAENDPFTGLPLLKLRYAAGRRPSEDISGLALSWQLTRQKDFAERALAEMKGKHITPSGKPSRFWIDYVRWALAFDWLVEYPGFARTEKDRIAQELMDGAAAMLATPDFSDPGQLSYHNYATRYLALAAFTSAAVDGYPGCGARCDTWRKQVSEGLENVLAASDFVSPEGSYHESLDYMRITWAALTLLAELQRTTTGVDPAQTFSVFRNIGNTYLYKLMPNGTPSREGDNEYPILDHQDTAVVGYSVNRFKDPYSAWLLRKSGFFVSQWVVPVLEFLWDDPAVAPRDPALAKESELPQQRYFPGVGHLVMRSGWKPDSTWIEFDCGPYLAKHQHLDQNQFTIYHNGYLAIDSGADYTETESPHYLNYYRRTVAHNSLLVYDPAEKFFWSDNVVPAANDGGQRMDSARYWNTIRNAKDWERTRDLWDLGQMRVIDYEPGQYHYALGDASRAYSRRKLRCFTRELVYIPAQNLLFVFDRVVSTQAGFKKAWLLHGVNPPIVDQDSQTQPGAQEFSNAGSFRFRDGNGELLVHSLLPQERTITRRGGAGHEFVAPGNEQGGGWGSGENWPLEPAEGGPLPTDPRLLRMWKAFWGQDLKKMERSNRQNVVPGSWRIEVSPARPAEEDFFLHVLEIGDSGMTGKKQVRLVDGLGMKGAVFEGGPTVLFSASGNRIDQAEVSLPGLACHSLLLTGLQPGALYELSLSGLNVSDAPDATLPGVLKNVLHARANEKGVLRMEGENFREIRLRIARA
ncbi:MAG: heparinase II/III family protein [Acidobacteria bacterium]|nr:heparinase II/III family protein [Acidobacteriota bacterium]